MPAPYDNLESVVNAARARLNDMIVSAGGDILTDSNVFTITAVNSAWRKLQEFLAKLGFLRFHRETFLTDIPALGGNDPGLIARINWQNYFNGASYFVAPVLPQDFIMPLEDGLEERPSGSGRYYTMDKVEKVPLALKGPWHKLWAWSDDTLWLAGSLVITDIRLRYAAFLPDFAAAAIQSFASQPVPISRAGDALAHYVVFEMAGARGDIDAGSAKTLAEEAATALVARENPGVLAPVAGGA